MKPQRDRSACICGVCMVPIDREDLLRAIQLGLEYRHECGRVLSYARQAKP